MISNISVVQAAALGFAVLAFFVTFAALLTPAWQVVYAREIEQWIQSGLWLNCQTRPSGMYTCTYSFSDSDYDFYTSAELINFRTPPFYSWQRHLMIIYLIAQLLTFLSFSSFFFSLNPSTKFVSALAFSGLLGVTLLIHVGATLTFMVFTQMVEYRFYHVSVSGIYEKHRGYSFFIELFAMLFFLISLVLSVVHLVRVKMGRMRHTGADYRLRAEFYGLDPVETRLAMRDLPREPKYL